MHCTTQKKTFNPIGNYEWELKIAQELGIENAEALLLSIEKQLKERKPKPKDWVPYKRLLRN
jgi:hypothetical protein